jgi:hypothetical protein
LPEAPSQIPKIHQVTQPLLSTFVLHRAKKAVGKTIILTAIPIKPFLKLWSYGITLQVFRWLFCKINALFLNPL